LLDTNVSKELAASIFRLEMCNFRGSIGAMTPKERELRNEADLGSWK
jgi:hypothetical protein